MPKSTNRSRPTRRRSELERLLDLTVLEPTHPELGRAGSSWGQPRRTAAWPRPRTATPTGWDGSSCAARSRRARSSTTDAASMPAGTRIICRSSPHAENLAFKHKTHCKHGHPLSGDNVRVDPRTGARVCRACARRASRGSGPRQGAKPAIASRILRFGGNQGYLGGALTSSGCSTVLSWGDPIRR